MNKTRLSAAIIALTVVLALAASPVMAAGSPKGNPGWVGNDYFAHHTDAHLKELLAKVERAHLAGSNFYAKWNAGDIQYALGDLNYTLWVFPNHPKALHYMCAIAKTTEEYSLPIEPFQTALEKFPQHAITHAQFGRYLVEIGEIEGGMKKLGTALTLDPDLAPGHAWMAEALLAAGATSQAMTSVDRARELGFNGKIKGLDQ